MRISILGPSGGGKSALSRKLCERFNLPRLEIDRLWFTHGGHELLLNGGTDKDKKLLGDKIQEDINQFLDKNDNWVIDGTYTKLQPIIADKADQVLFIKRPLYRRVLSHMLRIIKGKDRHPETGIWQDIKFSKTIVRRWRENENAKLGELLKKYETKLVTLESFKEIDAYFNSLVEQNKF